jgi:glycosyltransferase involved in cell wall biosynthesis
MRVAEIIRFYSLDDIMEFVEKGGEYPLHHVWCYDRIKESGITVKCIEYDKNSRWSAIGNKFQIFNLQQQINLLKSSNEFDLIYAPFVSDIFLLAVLKIMGLYKKPIFALALDTHVPYKKHFLKKLKEKIIRQVYNHGIDSILFFNEKIYEKSNEYGPLCKNSSCTDWGVDLDFFQLFTERQTESPTLDFIYSTGGSGRDFKTLINAFNEIDFNLKITTKYESLQNNNRPNVFIDNSVKPGLQSVGLIRMDYYNCLAVAIPLLKAVQQNTFGITVIMEALAMGKPIISTVNPLYPFDLEKEKIGLYVDYDDVNGWKHSVNYLINNPDEAREMGERGRFLCEKKYNYNLFSKEVIKHIKMISLINQNKISDLNISNSTNRIQNSSIKNAL